MPGRHKRLKVIFLSSNGLAVKCSCNKTQRSAYISSSATLESKVLFFSGSGIKVVFSSGSKTHEIYSSWKSYKYSLESPTVDRCTACRSCLVLFLFMVAKTQVEHRGPQRKNFSSTKKNHQCVRLYWCPWPEFN